MREWNVQRRDGKRFDRLRSDPTGDPLVRVVHGPLRGSGIDAVQSIVVLTGSIRQARSIADDFWELKMDTPLIESSAMVCDKGDPSSNVIKNVKIVGLTSPNKGRRYSASALKTAIPLYEHKSVNFDHVKPGESRKVGTKFGRLENVAFVEGDGLRGDIRYNPEHPLAKQVAWVASNMPEQIGMSHHSFGACRRDAQGEIVEQIKSVKSVDLVDDPATTKGLFEDNGTELSASVLGVIAEEKTTTADKVRRIKELLEGSATPQPTKKGHHMELSELTIEQLMESRSDLISALTERVKKSIEKDSKTTELVEENKNLKLKLDELEVKQKTADKKAMIDKELTESKLPDSAITPKFRELLEGAADQKAVKELIEDRQKIAGTSQKPKAREQTPTEAAGRQEGAGQDRVDIARNLRG